MRTHLDPSHPHLAEAQAAMRARAEEQAAPPRVDQTDKPFTISELMLLHGFSRRTVIRLYQDEPGVQILQAPRDHQQKIGRRYRTLRVPPHVHLRVKHRLEVK